MSLDRGKPFLGFRGPFIGIVYRVVHIFYFSLGFLGACIGIFYRVVHIFHFSLGFLGAFKGIFYQRRELPFYSGPAAEYIFICVFSLLP